ncbi:tyrosine-type recombinase/integrase [Rhizobium phaseoli]|uniref:tyrosine-type recombinase/integrase n=1 Tax=Rhizobium phaseoli TaxID=396 RepID=UPI0025566FA1|nr:site-specific integrase [Rhizobium phaseoli]MDK4730511.1 site-specific integrase [Rhizobium phaseoli]
MPTPVLGKADNGHYYAFWSEGKRSRRKSMGTKIHADAEQRFAQWLLIGGHRNDLSAEGKAALTVGQLWDVYWTKHVEKECVMPDNLRFSWSNMEAHFKDLTLQEVTQDVIDDYTAKRTTGTLGRKVKPVTVRKELAALRACFGFCAQPKHKPRIMEKADIPAFDLPPDAEARDRWLTTAEIQLLMSSASKLRPGKTLSRLERFLWLALETAARKQAIMELTWDRVDFEIGVIHYDVPGRKKTKKRRVSVAISDALMPILQRAHKERENDLVMENAGEIWASIQIAVERSGIIPARVVNRKAGEKPKSTGVSPHTLRHTAATHMARRGVPLYDIAGVLGNSLAMVEKVYAKHCPDRLRAAVNSISAGVLEAAE